MHLSVYQTHTNIFLEFLTTGLFVSDFYTPKWTVKLQLKQLDWIQLEIFVLVTIGMIYYQVYEDNKGRQLLSLITFSIYCRLFSSNCIFLFSTLLIQLFQLFNTNWLGYIQVVFHINQLDCIITNCNTTGLVLGDFHSDNSIVPLVII